MPESDRPQLTCGPPAIIIGCTIGILFIMPFVQGIVDDCPRKPFIPVYLYFPLVMSIILGIFSWWTCDSVYYYSGITIFCICWFIAGNVAIYSIYEPNYNKTTTKTDPYCNKTLYLFAFWITNLTYILTGVLFFACGCCLKQKVEGDGEAQTLIQE